MGIFERIGNGWNLAMDSFSVIKKNKSLLIFPILSTLSLLLIMGSFIGGIHVSSGIDSLKDMNVTARYFLLFVFYIVNYTSIVFFNVALIHCAQKILSGAKTTVKDGIMYSFSKFPQVLSWALISATVGVILRNIEDKNDTIGNIVGSIFGMLWALATFFVVPVMVYENLGVFKAIERSISLIKSTWGERIGAEFNFHLIGFLVFFAVGVPLALLTFPLSAALGFIVLIILGLIVTSIISAAEAVFTAAAYQYATGKPVEGFNRLGLHDIFAAK